MRSDVILDIICWTLEWRWTCFWLFPTSNDLEADKKSELFPQRRTIQFLHGGWPFQNRKWISFSCDSLYNFISFFFLFPLGALVTVLESIGWNGIKFAAPVPEQIVTTTMQFLDTSKKCIGQVQKKWHIKGENLDIYNVWYPYPQCVK